jgi:hypothetical protein
MVEQTNFIRILGFVPYQDIKDILLHSSCQQSSPYMVPFGVSMALQLQPSSISLFLYKSTDMYKYQEVFLFSI